MVAPVYPMLIIQPGYIVLNSTRKNEEQEGSLFFLKRIRSTLTRLSKTIVLVNIKESRK